MRKSTIYLFVLAVALVATAALASASLVVSAQNTNSSTTMTKTSKPKPKVRRKAAPAMPRCDNTKQEQTDLSGTYTGKLKHGDEPAMDGTLTITAINDMFADRKPINGVSNSLPSSNLSATNEPGPTHSSTPTNC